MTSIGTLFAFVLVCGGIMIMRKTHPHAERPFRAPLVPFVPIGGILVCLYVALFEDPSGGLLGEYFGGVIPPSNVAAPIIVGEQETIAAIDGRLWSKAGIESPCWRGP